MWNRKLLHQFSRPIIVLSASRQTSVLEHVPNRLLYDGSTSRPAEGQDADVRRRPGKSRPPGYNKSRNSWLAIYVRSTPIPDNVKVADDTEENGGNVQQPDTSPVGNGSGDGWCPSPEFLFIYFSDGNGAFVRCLHLKSKQEVKVIWQKAPHGGPIPRVGITPGGRKLYHWIPGVGFPISVP